MHILFIHRNFPAQFGHIASYLIQQKGYKCTFVSETPPGRVGGIYKIQYEVKGGATRRTHYSARTFENGVWHADAVYKALKPLKERVRPDLIVGHSGFGSTLFLHELYPGVPVINLFEYFYRSEGADLGFRPEFPVAEADRLRSLARNAMIMLDLEYCTAGYAPTRFQHDCFPRTYHPKLRVLHDGIPTDFWRRHRTEALTLGDLAIQPGTRVVTYVSRGFESMRGFDIFMQVAQRLCDRRKDVMVVVIGTDRVCYGGDLKYIKEDSFKAHVLNNGRYDLDRIRFVGRLEPKALVRMLSRSDLHLYLTVPFVLSWSVLDAMACECTMLCSDTAPVREVIRHEQNGLLCDFYDVDGFTETALAVLDDPQTYHAHLGRAARATIEQNYSMETIMPQMVQFYEEVAGRS